MFLQNHVQTNIKKNNFLFNAATAYVYTIWVSV